MTCSQALEIRPLTGRIGAEIVGVQASDDLDAETVAVLRATLRKYKAIFFRNQGRLALDKQEAFSKLFGEIIPHPTVPKIQGAEVALQIAYADGTTASNEWHTDETFMEIYPMAGVLHAVTLPSRGGDTMWANTATAYENMPAPLRDLADKLWALHSNMSSYNSARRHSTPLSTMYETEHSLVRVHPETQERVMVLGFHAQKILEMNRADSARLINIFQDHITRPENTVRWRWSLGDLAVWDNRSTQHYGVGDFTERRELHRVSVQGEAHISVDGRKSVVRTKEEFRTRVIA